MAVRERVEPEAGRIVDMSWDPITRIVGNLGIYTKIDFDRREVVSSRSLWRHLGSLLSVLLEIPRRRRISFP